MASIARLQALNGLPERSSGVVIPAAFHLLALVCLVLVSAEGLTRGTKVVYGGDLADVDVLAFGKVFAWLTVPLIAMYASSVRASVAEGALYWLALGSIVYDKSFAYTRLPGLPLYATDVALLLCCWDLWRRKAVDFAAINKWHRIALGLFVVAGGIAAVRGIAGSGDAFRVARDSAIVGYALFAVVAVSAFRSWLALKRFLAVAGLGAVLVTINASLWFLTTPDLRRYIPYPVFVAAAVTTVIVLRMGGWKGWKSTGLIGVFVLGVILGNSRTTEILGIPILSAMVIVAAILWRGASTKMLKTAAITAIVAALLISAAFQTRSGQDFLDRKMDQLVSAMNYEGDDNAVFRLLAWTEAYSRFEADPVLGEGYGIPFVFALSDDDPRPHNTYLTVLYKMGIAGFLPFVAFLAVYYYRAFTQLHTHRLHPQSTWLLVLISVQLSFCGFGTLNLLLESPFLASFFWINVGMTYAAMRLLNNDAASLALKAAQDDHELHR